jgi:hypothetical protein
MHCGMLRRMARRRRGETDSLNPVDAPCWLVIRDRVSRVVEHRALAPRADLRAALKAQGEVLAAAGWTIGDIPRNCSFFFADRGNDRVCVSIDCYEPGHVPASYGGGK